MRTRVRKTRKPPLVRRTTSASVRAAVDLVRGWFVCPPVYHRAYRDRAYRWLRRRRCGGGGGIGGGGSPIRNARRIKSRHIDQRTAEITTASSPQSSSSSSFSVPRKCRACNVLCSVQGPRRFGRICHPVSEIVVFFFYLKNYSKGHYFGNNEYSTYDVKSPTHGPHTRNGHPGWSSDLPVPRAGGPDGRSCKAGQTNRFPYVR